MDVRLLILLVLTTMRADLIISAHHYKGRLKGNHRNKRGVHKVLLFFTTRGEDDEKQSLKPSLLGFLYLNQ